MNAPLTVASFWIDRPNEFPNPADHYRTGHDYPTMLRALQASCDRLNVRHVILSDFTTARADLAERIAGMECFRTHLPDPLMQACTRVQAKFLEAFPSAPGDVLFVGADSILLRHPDRFYPKDADMFFTFRPGHLRYPINSGAMMIREHAREGSVRFFKRVADRTGPTWGDDQRALADELAPLPRYHGEIERHGLKIRLLPMRIFNDVPAGVEDPCNGKCLLHFRGRKHKPKMIPWAKRWGFL